MAIKKGTMREVIGSVNDILSKDEDLLRFLWYLPEDVTGTDPLDTDLLNVKDMSNYWDIVNERIVLAEKVDDLVANPICRIYISAGRRRPKLDSYLMASQEIIISVYVHDDYEIDGRSASIGDRIGELLVLERVKGAIAKLEYWGGNPRQSPIRYTRFDHIYEFTTSMASMK